MNQADLIARLRARHDYLPAQDVDRCYDRIRGAIVQALAANRRVEIRGFGVLHLSAYDTHDRRDPLTGELSVVGPRMIPRFKAAKALQDELNPPDKPAG